MNRWQLELLANMYWHAVEDYSKIIDAIKLQQKRGGMVPTELEERLRQHVGFSNAIKEALGDDAETLLREALERRRHGRV